MERCVWMFILAGAVAAACAGSDGEETPAADTADTDTDSGTDTDTMPPTPYDDIDCDGAGASPENCEYEICMNKEFYVDHLLSCMTTSPLATCYDSLSCYDDLVACLRTACPPGTAVPATKEEKDAAGYYQCKSDFSACNLGVTP